MQWSAAHTLAAGALTFGLALAHGARAAEPDASTLSRAHDAYARGEAAFAQKDFVRAARELALADSLVPDPVTLGAALQAVTLADDPILGAELLDRASRASDDVRLASAVSAARARFAHRTGAVFIRCDGCLAVVDGAPALVGARHVVLPGVHTVTLQRGDAPPQPRLVSVGVDEQVDVWGEGAAPPPAPASVLPLAGPVSHGGGGLSPFWFASSAAVVVALGAVTTWSALQTVSDHSTFEGDRCDVVATSGCQSQRANGQSEQTRTLWLGVGMGAAAVGTALLGAFGVRWHRAAGTEVSFGVGAPSATVRVTF